MIGHIIAIAATWAAGWAWHRATIADRAAETGRHARRDCRHTTADEADLHHRANGIRARIWMGVDR